MRLVRLSKIKTGGGHDVTTSCFIDHDLQGFNSLMLVQHLPVKDGGIGIQTSLQLLARQFKVV